MTEISQDEVGHTSPGPLPKSMLRLVDFDTDTDCPRHPLKKVRFVKLEESDDDSDW